VADPNRKDGFERLSERDPGGPLACFAAPPAGQAVLRGRSADGAFRRAAEAALGFALPEDALMAHAEGARAAFRLGPDYWLVVDEGDPAFGRRIAATPGLIAMDMSSARSRARLRGAQAPDLLAAGAAIDLRSSALPTGAFAQTTVGNATAILHVRAPETFDIYIARSFARSWLVWLAHAGREFGLRIGDESQ